MRADVVFEPILTFEHESAIVGNGGGKTSPAHFSSYKCSNDELFVAILLG